MTFNTWVIAQALLIVLTTGPRMIDQPFTHIVQFHCNTCLSWCPFWNTHIVICQFKVGFHLRSVTNMVRSTYLKVDVCYLDTILYAIVFYMTWNEQLKRDDKQMPVVISKIRVSGYLVTFRHTYTTPQFLELVWISYSLSNRWFPCSSSGHISHVHYTDHPN